MKEVNSPEEQTVTTHRAPASLSQRLALSSTFKLWEAAHDSPGTWGLAMHMGEREQVLSFLFYPGLASAAVGIWE